jgi:hypothetical protein
MLNAAARAATLETAQAVAMAPTGGSGKANVHDNPGNGNNGNNGK